MPGRNYVASIRDFWRVCSGVNEEARARVVKFLTEVLNTEKFPLTVLDRPIESETTKIVENSYRATILAFLDEWSLFAERNGVDLIKVIKAIKVRPTHSNMIFPGPGIGGYCLPKDGGLGMWAYKHLFGFEDDIFHITPTAIDINDTRALHVAELMRDALRNMGRYVAGATSWSAAPATARTWATPATAAPSWSSASSRRWAPRSASTTPTWTTGGSSRTRRPTPPRASPWARFFRNQEDVDGHARPAGPARRPARAPRPSSSPCGTRRTWSSCPSEVVGMGRRPAGRRRLLRHPDDDQIRRYFELGCEVKGLGRGHVQRIKEDVRRTRAR